MIIVCREQVFFISTNLFKEGRERVDDEPRPGRPSTSTDDQHVDKIQELTIYSQRSYWYRWNIGKIQFSENHLGLRKVKARLVPKSFIFSKNSVK